MIFYILLFFIPLFFYSYLKLQPDKNVAQLPRVSPLLILYHVLIGTPAQLREKLILLPSFSKSRFINVFLGQWYVFVKDAEIIKKILLDDETFVKTKISEMMNDFGLFGTNFAEEPDKGVWKSHRKIINPAFKRGWDLGAFVTVANKICDIAQNAVNQEIEVLEVFKAATLDSLGLSILGIDFNSINNSDNQIAYLYNKISDGILSPLFYIFPFLDYFPFTSRMKLYDDTAKLRNYIKKLIDAERERLSVSGSDKQGTNVLSLMVQSSDSGSEGLTNEMIIDDTIVFIIAGHDTTAHTLASAVYYLARYPEIQQKVRQEIKKLLGPKSTLEELISNHTILNETVYLESVIYETMRTIPAIPILNRKLSRPVTLENNLLLNTGQEMTLHVGLAMKDPTLFKNPEEFQPERFLIAEDNQTKIDKKMTNLLLNFGYGTRMCMGNQFSLLEQKVFLIALVHNFNITLPENSPHHDHPILPPAFTLHSPQDLKVKFTKL
ncbi:cytochrome P450 [Neoconidiobolus thromboides FSU 785]|nr:cytochrome P450 [Neoconidiobolus thromboides FSU 785]